MGMTGPKECRCGEQWTIQKIKLPDGRVFRNYWCRYCDGIPLADKKPT
jgi:hypothetical protein